DASSGTAADSVTFVAAPFALDDLVGCFAFFFAMVISSIRGCGQAGFGGVTRSRPGNTWRRPGDDRPRSGPPFARRGRGTVRSPASVGGRTGSGVHPAGWRRVRASRGTRTPLRPAPAQKQLQAVDRSQWLGHRGRSWPAPFLGRAKEFAERGECGSEVP